MAKGSRDFLSDAEVKLLGTASDAVIARKTGRSVASIEKRRRSRSIPSHRDHEVAARWKRWDRKLGKMPDTAIADKMGISSVAVLKRRTKLRIKPFAGKTCF